MKIYIYKYCYYFGLALSLALHLSLYFLYSEWNWLDNQYKNHNNIVFVLNLVSGSTVDKPNNI